MTLKRIDEVAADTVRMDGVEGVTMRLLIGREDGAPNFAMRQFTVQPGGHTPLHQHNYEHEVLVQGGFGEVQMGEQSHPLTVGSVLLVPANLTHQFRNTGDEPLQFICMVPVSFDCSGQCQPVPGS